MTTVMRMMCIVAGLYALIGAARAQNYPVRPVRIIVPATPGNPSDIIARIIGTKLSEFWGQSVVFENRPGAGGTVGIAQAAKAAPDGYTLLIAVGGFLTNAAIQPNLPYDSVNDFSAVAQLGFPASLLVVSQVHGFKTVADLVVFGKANPGKVLFGSAGAGGGSHLQGERFRLAAGIRATHVGFKGQPEALIEVLTGRVHYSVPTFGAAYALVKDGRLLALGVNTPQRLPQLPDVPTLGETLPEFKRPETTNSLFAPARTPRAILDRINQDVRRSLASPDIVEKLNTIAFTIQPTSPEEADKIRRTQIESLTKLAIASGLRAK